MGSQQLLLTVVGIIVVGLMIYAGYNISKDYMENANRDHVISTLYDLGLMAQQHYKKDKTQGGGGGTYIGWSIPNNFKSTEVSKKIMADFVGSFNVSDYTTHIYNDTNVEKGILNFSKSINADLIGMSTHGRKGLSHFFNGSISEDLVNHAQRPVVTFKI